MDQAGFKLVVGLGNPGAKYASNRHNAGFHVVDEVAAQHKASWQRKFRGQVARVGDAWFLKPETFMNLSGESVTAACGFFRVGLSDVLVVHDDMELELGRVQVKEGGGHGGHNGLRSIEAGLGGGFGRVRCGIGRPPAEWDPADFVLSDFRADEVAAWKEAIALAVEAVEVFIGKGLVAAMNRVNRQRPGESKS